MHLLYFFHGRSGVNDRGLSRNNKLVSGEPDWEDAMSGGIQAPVGNTSGTARIPSRVGQQDLYVTFGQVPKQLRKTSGVQKLPRTGSMKE